MSIQWRGRSPLSPPWYTGCTREIVQTVLENPALVGLTPAQQALAVSPFDTEDFQEGWRAFLEKRTPQFRGY